jgi:hypothetical protein
MTAMEKATKAAAKLPKAVVKREFELSTGEKVVVREAKGKDAEKAMRFAGKDQKERYFTALVSLTVTIDGKAIIPEALGELPLRDYNKVTEAFADLNF